MTEGSAPGQPNEQAGPGVPPGYGAPPPPPYGGYGPQGGYAPPGGYGALGGYGVPGGYGPPGGYGTPGGYGAPGGYGTPGGYGAYGGGPYGRPQAPKPGIVPLRPLNMTEILDGAFAAIRWNPKTILTSSAAVATISAVLIAVVSYVLQRQVLSTVRVAGSSSLQLTASQAVWLLSLYGLTVLITFLADSILTGLLTVAIGQGVLGRKETLASVWRTAAPRIWRLIGMLLLITLFYIAGLAVIVGVSVGVGLAAGPVAGAIVGIVLSLTASVFAAIVAVRWQMAIPVVMLERLGPLKSLGRSWRLVRRSSWRVFGILLLTYLIVLIAVEVINLPFALGSGGLSLLTTRAHVNVAGLVVQAIGQIVAGTVAAPMISGVITLLYTDLRMRREGMDITLQAATAGPAAGDRLGGQNVSPW
ncbi:MAG TPA: glycerophosphoryl diester phosphodiesterase membrane domain-containing protein [Trebonia sp.]|nr:glycerophosphoryl diester phosphodiesterase membrane domain-containing protein [Trebonia sp.]